MLTLMVLMMVFNDVEHEVNKTTITETGEWVKIRLIAFIRLVPFRLIFQQRVQSHLLLAANQSREQCGSTRLLIK